MNLFYDIPSGDNPPELINVVIEVETRSRDKYEYREEYGAFFLDRVIYSPAVFPIDYGFIPRTWCDDNDPLDVMVMTYEPLEVGCVVRVRPIGVLILEDENGKDPKILGVPNDDPRYSNVKSINDVEEHKLNEISEFFKTYKRLEPHKWVKMKSWEDEKDAKRIIEESMELYKNVKKK